MEVAAHRGTALRGRELDGAVILEQMGAKVVRVELPVFRPVAGGAITGARSEETGLRHEHELAVVADPGAGLMRRAEALQLPVTRMEEPAAAALVRLRAPVRHPERPRDQRQRVPA